MPRYTPANCPHCEYDRRFPGFEGGGWMQMPNNGPIVSCPLCNEDGSHLPYGDEDEPERDELPNCVWRGAATPFAKNH